MGLGYGEGPWIPAGTAFMEEKTKDVWKHFK